jgi:DNA ligase-1
MKLIVIDSRVFEIVHSSDVIDAPSKTGTKFWQGHVVKDGAGVFYTTTASWKTTNSGLSKIVWAIPYKGEPKNVGRANETTNMDQAFLEFESMVKKEIDKRQSTKPLPMLAQPYGDRKKYIKFPCAIQPKYDGMRMLYDGTTAWSRGNKEIIPEVVQHLHFDTKGHIIDGELILPDNPKVNEVMKAAKKYRPGVSDKLIYRVYDIVDETMTFQERFFRLTEIVNGLQTNGNANIVLSNTVTVGGEELIEYWHSEFVKEGYEGSIIRNLDGRYTINKRSNDLQKHKDFVDGEYEIVDIVPAGGGSSSEVGKFVCRTENGDLFESTATGTEAERREYLSNKLSYIGKFAKVKYRELSGATNVPFHSNVLEIRETENAGY